MEEFPQLTSIECQHLLLYSGNFCRLFSSFSAIRQWIKLGRGQRSKKWKISSFARLDFDTLLCRTFGLWMRFRVKSHLLHAAPSHFFSHDDDASQGESEKKGEKWATTTQIANMNGGNNKNKKQNEKNKVEADGREVNFTFFMARRLPCRKQNCEKLACNKKSVGSTAVKSLTTRIDHLSLLSAVSFSHVPRILARASQQKTGAIWLIMAWRWNFGFISLSVCAASSIIK